MWVPQRRHTCSSIASSASGTVLETRRTSVASELVRWITQRALYGSLHAGRHQRSVKFFSPPRPQYRPSLTRARTGSQSSPQELASRTAAYSLPNSQDSSLNDSSTSQQSQIPQASSTEDIRIAHGTHHLHGTTTPSTSVSNKSSREVIGTAAPPVDQDILSSQEKRHPANPSVVRQPNHSISDLQHEHTSTPKRMANGEIKSPEYSLPTSPVGASQYGHSRDSSRTSKGSQISNVGESSRSADMLEFLTVDNSYLVKCAHVSRTPWSKFRTAGSRTISTNLSL